MTLRALLLAVLLGAAPTLHAQSSPAATGAVSLRAGDVLRVKVWENEELSGDFEVAPDSSLRHPVYNRLKVAGVPVTQLHARIREFLLTFEREPLVEVEPLLRVVVGGEVRSPNIYLLGPEVTVADAIARAGGVGAEGRLDAVTVERAGARRRLDLTRPDASAAETVRSGDLIVVDRRRRLLRDVVGPLASVAATVVSLLTLARQ
jgi:protein involved in polysaccharide export with SLBB domain